MKSLRELAKTAVVKHGVGQRDQLPENLQKELEKVEEAVRSSITGQMFYQFYVVRPIEFDIGWNNGTWRFIMRRERWSRRPALIATVKSHSMTFMSPPWTEVFGLGCTKADHNGFWIYDFAMNVEERKVTFYGDYVVTRGIFHSRQFATEFWFSKTTFFVRIKCSEWNPVRHAYYTCSERCFEQPDSDDWRLMHKDNAAHTPRCFHVPLFNKFH
jgi:hypothetical protein